MPVFSASSELELTYNLEVGGVFCLCWLYAVRCHRGLQGTQHDVEPFCAISLMYLGDAIRFLSSSAMSFLFDYINENVMIRSSHW